MEIVFFSAKNQFSIFGGAIKANELILIIIIAFENKNIKIKYKRGQSKRGQTIIIEFFLFLCLWLICLRWALSTEHLTNSS